MKTNLNKGLLLAFLCCFSINLLVAQDVEGDDPAPGVSITPPAGLLSGFSATISTPILKSSSVIHYSDGLSSVVEFESGTMVPTFAVLVNKANSADTRTLNLINGKTEFTGLTPGKLYDIKVPASNGQYYIVGTVNTSPFKAGEPVIVSEKLYRALSVYVSNENQTVTLSNYLKQLGDISQHEKVAFLQQYIMNGAILPATIKGQYPDSYVKTALEERKTEGECICNFVMNQVTVVVPDQTGIHDFQIGPKTTIQQPTHYNNASYWARGLTAQGAAKNQLLFSEGRLAGNKTRTETWISGGETVSDNFVRIGYHLMCLGITELPKECDCTKTISYDFGYSTRIESRSNTGGFGCVFTQTAAAQAQDWAVAVVTREKVNSVNDVQILQSGLGTATSECAGGVPATVFIDLAKIGVSVFQLIKSVKTAQLSDVAAQTTAIIDKVGAVLTPLTESKNCNSSVIDKPLLQGVANISFKANDPLSFMVISGSSLMVTGKRCWSSSASIKSSFHLAGVVAGGAPSADAPHCCTEYFTNWAYASQNGDESNRRNFINGHVALNNPGGWQMVNGQPNPTGSLNASTAIGYGIGKNLPQGQQCAKVIPIFNNPH